MRLATSLSLDPWHRSVGHSAGSACEGPWEITAKASLTKDARSLSMCFATTSVAHHRNFNRDAAVLSDIVILPMQ